MADKSQERALAYLREAKEKGTLDPSVEAGLAELIGTTSRPKLKEVLAVPLAPKSSVGSEQAEAEKRELTPEQIDRLINEFIVRLKQPGSEFGWVADKVEKSLRAYPDAILAIHRLEADGDEIQLIDIDGDEFVFAVPSAKVESLGTPWTYSLRVKNRLALYS